MYKPHVQIKIKKYIYIYINKINKQINKQTNKQTSKQNKQTNKKQAQCCKLSVRQQGCSKPDATKNATNKYHNNKADKKLTNKTKIICKKQSDKTSAQQTTDENKTYLSVAHLVIV